MDCDFDNPAAVCPRCGFHGRPGLQKNCKQSPEITTPCAHLGRELRRKICPTCQGETKIFIFACAVHAECAISDRLPGVKCCGACGQYQPRPAAQAG